MEFAVAADHVFDGTLLRHDYAVVIEGPRIRAVMPRNDVPESTCCHRLPRGAWLVPGFIDTQVNGGGDVLFNDDPSPRGIAAIAADIGASARPRCFRLCSATHPKRCGQPVRP